MQDKFTVTLSSNDMLQILVSLAITKKFGEEYIFEMGDKDITAEVLSQDDGSAIVSIEISEN